MQRLKLFGGISIETDGVPVVGRAVQRRRLALLALLAIARSRGMSRDRLIAFLWPEADSENGRRFLSDSVYRVNQALGGDAIIAAGDDLHLDAERLPSDFAEFEDAIARGDHQLAVKLYEGPLLDGFIPPEAAELERWFCSVRERLAREYAAALEALATAAEQSANAGAAVEWWRRLAAHDRYNSRVALRLMQALDATGDRAAAIQHARIHEILLDQELELEIDPAVRQFAERLRREPREATAPAPLRIAAPALPAPSLTPDSDATTDAPSRAQAVRSAPTGRRRARPVVLVAASLGILIPALATLWIVSRGKTPDAAPPAAAHTVAVLPFANLSGDRDNEYFSDGITEELIVTLGQVDGLRVASRTSSFVYKNKPSNIREVGRQLGVGAVVEGSVRKSGRTLRITVQLVSTTSGYDLWSESYERESNDVLAIQQEIARAIVSKLRGTLVGTADVQSPAGSTQDAEAYDLYLKGRFAWHRRSREGLGEAVRYFNEAIARAPGYARAYVGVADAHAVNAFYDYERPVEAYPKAEAAARRAIALEPTLAAPHATLGYVLTYYHLDWTRAEEEFKRALAMDPSYSAAHQWYGNLLTVAGRFSEAEREFRAAQEADPLSLIANAALAWSFYLGGRHEAAVEQCQRALVLNPNFELAHLWGGMALGQLGRDREAREWLERAVRLSSGTPITRLALAHQLARSTAPGDKERARAVVRELEARQQRGEYVPAYEIAVVYAALDDRDTAFAWLDRTVESRSHSRAYFKVDPQLAALRADPRFRALTAALFPGG